MNNDPTRELIDVLTEFGDFLKETEGKDGARTTKSAINLTNSLDVRQKKAEKRRLTWDWSKLATKHMNIENELQEISKQLYYTKGKND